MQQKKFWDKIKEKKIKRQKPLPVIKEADKINVTINTVSFSDGGTAENFGFKTNQVHLNVIDEGIRVQSFSTDYSDSSAVSIGSLLVAQNLL